MKLTHANFRKEEVGRNGNAPAAFGKYAVLAAAIALPATVGATTLFNKGDCVRDSLGLKMSVCFTDVSNLDKQTALFSISDTLANRSVYKTNVQVSPGTIKSFSINDAVVQIKVTETAVGSASAWAKADVRFVGGLVDTVGSQVELGQCYADSAVKVCFTDVSRQNDSTAMFEVRKATVNTVVDAVQIKIGETKAVKVDSTNYSITVNEFAAGSTSTAAWVRITVTKAPVSAVSNRLAAGHGPVPFSVYKSGNAYNVQFGKGTHEVELFSVNGTKLGTFSGNGIVNVPMDGHPSGVYLLRSTVAGQSVTARLNHF